MLTTARGLTVGHLREMLADHPDHLDVVLLLDHALAGHVDQATDCNAYDVEFTAPVIDLVRTDVGLEVHVEWEAMG